MHADAPSRALPPVGAGASIQRHSVAWQDVHDAIRAGLAEPITARALCRALIARGTPHPLRTVYRVLDKAEKLGQLQRVRVEKHTVRDRDEWVLPDAAPPHSG